MENSTAYQNWVTSLLEPDQRIIHGNYKRYKSEREMRLQDQRDYIEKIGREEIAKREEEWQREEFEKRTGRHDEEQDEYLKSKGI